MVNSEELTSTTGCLTTVYSWYRINRCHHNRFRQH